MKCNWNIYGLKDKLDKLKRIKKEYESKSSNAKNNVERSYIESIIIEIDNDVEMIEIMIESEFESPVNTKKLLTQYDEAKEGLLEIKYLWPELKEAHEITKSLTSVDIEEKRHTLSKEDLVELTHDFFKNALDKRLYGNFMKNFYRKSDHLRFVHNDEKTLTSGSIYPLFFSKENFVKIKRTYTICDLFSMIHEYMHATSSTLNPNHSYYEKRHYKEIDAVFAEMLAYDYFKGELPIYKLDLYRYMLHENFCDFVEWSAKVINLIEIENNNYAIVNNKILRAFSHEAGISDYEIDDIFDDVISTDIHTAAYMFALEFYKMYERDREKALNSLEKFIMFDGNQSKDYYKFLRGLKLIPNEHMREFHKEVNDSAKKLILK